MKFVDLSVPPMSSDQLVFQTGKDSLSHSQLYFELKFLNLKIYMKQSYFTVSLLTL